MPESSKRDDGIPLADAALTYGDPRDVARWRELKYKRAEFPDFVYPSPPRAGVWGNETLDRERNELERLEERLAHSLTDKLQTGQLVASGIASPLSPRSRRERINSDLWGALRLKTEDSSASADGFTVLNVLVAEPMRVHAANATKAAESECRRRLRDLIRAPKPASKSAIFESMSAAIGPTLSRRSFDRAWDEVVPDHWKRPGNPRT